MSANQVIFPVSAMTRVLGVSKAGFYALAAASLLRPCGVRHQTMRKLAPRR